jgi:hypothetical protein
MRSSCCFVCVYVCLSGIPIVFFVCFAVCITSNESRRLVLPRTSCFFMEFFKSNKLPSAQKTS